MNKVLETLPKKEAGELKNVITLYDNKKYKKASKTLDKIVTKFGNRDEYKMLDLLFKLSINESNSPENGPLIKESRKLLMKKLKSGFNWQILGLMYKKTKNYKEAGKSLLQSIKFEKGNNVLYRDACNNLLQSRDLLNHQRIRVDMLDLNPTLYSNWIAGAWSHDLVGDYDAALETLIYLKDMLEQEMKGKGQFDLKEMNAKTSKKNKKNKKVKAAENKDKNEEDEKKSKAGELSLYRHEYSNVLEYEIDLNIKLGKYVEALAMIKREYNDHLVDKTRSNFKALQILALMGDLKAMKPYIKKELVRNPNSFELNVLNIIIRTFNKYGDTIFNQESLDFISKQKYYSALKCIVESQTENPDVIKEIRDYLVLSAKLGSSEAVEYLAVHFDYLAQVDLQNIETSLRILIKKNSGSMHPGFVKKISIFLTKNNYAKLLFSEKSDSAKWSVEIAEQPVNPKSIMFDKLLVPVLQKINEWAGQFALTNPLVMIFKILLEELNSLNSKDSYCSTENVELSEHQQKMTEKYSKYLNFGVNTVTMSFYAYNLAFLLSKTNQNGLALLLLNFCIEFCSCLEEPYYLKSKILFKLGMWGESIRDLELFRRLNYQDRSSAFMSIKLLSKSGCFRKCEERLNYFMILDNEVPKIDRTRDLQKKDFLWRMTRGYKANGLMRKALRFANMTYNIFSDLKADQMDFFSFCFRYQNILIIDQNIKMADSLNSTFAYQLLVGKYLGLLTYFQNSSEIQELKVEDVPFNTEIKNYRYETEMGIQLEGLDLQYETLLQAENDSENVKDSEEVKQIEDKKEEADVKEVENDKKDDTKKETEETTEPKTNKFSFLKREGKVRTGNTLSKFNTALEKLDLHGEKLIQTLNITSEIKTVTQKILNGIDPKAENQMEGDCYTNIYKLKKADTLAIKNLSRCFKNILRQKNIWMLIRAYSSLLRRDLSFSNLLRRVQFYKYLFDHFKIQEVLTFSDFFNNKFENILDQNKLQVLHENVEKTKDPILKKILSSFLKNESILFEKYLTSQTSNHLLKNADFTMILKSYIEIGASKEFMKNQFENLKALILKEKKKYWVANRIDKSIWTALDSRDQIWLSEIENCNNRLLQFISLKQMTRFLKIELF